MRRIKPTIRLTLHRVGPKARSIGKLSTISTPPSTPIKHMIVFIACITSHIVSYFDSRVNCPGGSTGYRTGVSTNRLSIDSLFVETLGWEGVTKFDDP